MEAIYDRSCYFPDNTVIENNKDSDDKAKDGNDPCVVDQNLSPGCPFNAFQHLFPDPRSCLIRVKGGRLDRLTAECLTCKRYVIICTIYIPVTRNSQLAILCYDLQFIFSKLAMEKRDVMVVLVLRMRCDFPCFDDGRLSHVAFHHFFSAFSPFCLAVPILDTTCSLNLFQLLGSSKFSSLGCVVVDLQKEQLLCTNISKLWRFGPDLYPFTNERLTELLDQAYDISCGKIPLELLLWRKSSDVLHCLCGLHCGKIQFMSDLSNKVVWLYYYSGGDFMKELGELYKECRSRSLIFEVVVVCKKSYFCKTTGSISPLWDDRVSPLQCCGWYHVPFDYTLSWKLDALFKPSYCEQLAIFGPHGSYVEPDGIQVYRDYGIDAYPFTKQVVWDNEVARLRSLSLYEWLTAHGISAFQRNGEMFPVRCLDNTDVIVYFGWAPLNPDPGAWERHLPLWLNQMKLASRRNFEVIFVCSYVDEKVVPSLENYCSSLGMLFPVPHEKSRVDSLVDSLFGRPGVWGSSLAAFDGSSGRLLRLTLERTLTQWIGPAIFPWSDDSLRADVGILLNSQMGDDIWYRALDTPIAESFSRADVSFVVR